MPITDEDRAYVRSTLGSSSRNSDDSGQGFFGRAADYVGRLSDRFDPDWLPAGDDYSGADYLYNNVSRPLGAATRGVMQAGNWLGQSAFGGPVRAATTAATLGTGPLLGAAARALPNAPRLARAVTTGARTLHNVNRGADALQATAQGAQAAQNFQEGNYGQAAVNVGLGYLGQRGARQKFADVARPVTRPTNVPVVPQKSPDELLTESVNALGKPLSAAKTARIPQVARELQVLGTDPTPQNIRKHLSQRADVINESTRRANAIQPGASVEHIPTPETHNVTRKVVRQNLKDVGIEPTKENIDWVILERKRLQNAADNLAKERAAGNTATISGTLNAGRKMGDGPTNAAIDSVESNEPSWFQKKRNGIFMSMEEEFRRMGPAGKEVADMFVRARTDAPIRYDGYVNNISNDLRQIIKGKHKDVTGEDFEKIVDRIQGDTKVKLTDAQENLATRIKDSLRRAQEDMKDRGLITEVKENYFPEKYVSGLKTAREELRNKGWSEDEITAELQQRAVKGKGFIGMEQKPKGLEGARKDPSVLIEELRDVAHRIERVDNFGADYLKDGSRLMNSINATGQPLRAKDLAVRILQNSRQVADDSKKVTNAIKAYATASALSQTAVSQIGGAVPILARNSLRNAVGSIGQAFRKDKDYEFLRNANAFQDFSSHFDDNGMGQVLYKMYGIEGMQNAMTHWAGRTGLATAKTLLSQLKKNPANETARAQLKDLILDDIESVLKQDDLTEHQMKRAMKRMGEITQGSPDQEKLPYHWVGSGFRQIPQIFLRMGLQGSKAIKDGLKQGTMMDKVGTAAKIAGSGLVAGELIGDIKEIPKTAAEVAVSNLDLTGDNKDFFPEYLENIGAIKGDDTQDRFQYTRQMVKEAFGNEAAKNDLFVRALSNVINSYSAGMLSDAVIGGSEVANSREPFNAALSSFWAIDEANSLTDMVRDAAKGNFQDPMRELVKKVPFFGQGAARSIRTQREVEKGLKPGTGGYGRSGGGGRYTITYENPKKR